MRSIAATLRERWAVPGDLKFIRNFSNVVYGIFDNNSKCYLRLSPESQKTRQMIESELEFILHLHSENIAVARPIESRSGSLVESIASDGQTCNACLFEEAPGVEFRELVEPDLREFFLSSGEIMGRVHSASRIFKQPPGFLRPDWTEDRWHKFEKLVPKKETAAWKQYREIIDWVKTLPLDKNYFGHIHGDFNISNMRFDGDRITLFDFDSSCRHWYAYDIAVFLHLFGAGKPEARKLAYESVLEGYGRTSVLDDTIIAQIPLFGKMRLLFSYLVFAEEWGFENLEKEQEDYFEYRRKLFEQPPTWPGI